MFFANVGIFISLNFEFLWTELLKHDKLLSKKAPVHLRNVPSYLIDPVAKEGIKQIKLSREAIGLNKSKRRGRIKRGSGKSKDILKSVHHEV